MCQSHSRVCCIDTLSAVSGCTEHIEFTVIHIQMEIDFLCFRHNSNCTGRGMDTSAGFCFRNSLHTMYTTFIFQSGISTCTCDHKCYFLKSADSVLIETHHFCFPAAGFCIFHIHTVNLCCKKGSFIPTCTCTDLHNNVLVIIRIFRKKKDLKFMLQFLYILLCLRQFFLQHFPHIFIFLFLKHGKTVLYRFFVFLILPVSIYYRLQIALLFHQLLKMFLIIGNSRLSKLIKHLFKTNEQIV